MINNVQISDDKLTLVKCFQQVYWCNFGVNFNSHLAAYLCQVFLTTVQIVFVLILIIDVEDFTPKS